MARKNQHKKNRLPNDKVDLYGPNRRKLLYEYPVIKKRMLYLCDFLFHGDHHEMAAALGICYRQIQTILSGRSRVTVSMAAQIVARLGVRAEWLLCGVGDVFVNNTVTESFVLPKTFNSSFQIFDAVNQFAGLPEFLPPVPVPPAGQIAATNFIDVAKAVYAARIEKRSAGFFLGSDAFLAAPAPVVLPFLKAQYVNLVVPTLEYVQFDLHRALRVQPDLNSIAVTAASRGIGYGEAIGLTALPPGVLRESSLVVSAYDMGVTTAVATEIGELSAHAAAPIRGAETAAALGAAAYVDLLVATEQIRNFVGTPGGVFIVVGEVRRGVRFFLQRLEALKTLEPACAGFTLVLFSSSDPPLQTYVEERGGHVIFLGNPTTASIMQLMQTCDDVYAGKIK